MRRTLAILGVLAYTSLAYADLAQSNISTGYVDKVTGQFNSFRWKWPGYTSQTNTLYFFNGTTATPYVLTGYTVAFKMSKQTATGQVSYISTTNVTVNSNVVTWVTANTNIPPSETYDAELFAWEGVATNTSRVIAQGLITTFKSLYDDTDADFPWPDRASLAAYATIAYVDSRAAITNHALLTNLAYADAGHTGFQPTIAGTVVTNGANVSVLTNDAGYGVGDVVAASINAFLATNTAPAIKANSSAGFSILSSSDATCVTFGAGGGCTAQFGDGANFAGQVQVASLNVTNGSLLVTNSHAIVYSASTISYLGYDDSIYGVCAGIFNSAQGAVVMGSPNEALAVYGRGLIDTPATNGYDIVNYQTMTNYVTQNGGISADTATNISRDAWQLAYLLEDASGTATVSRTVGGTNYAEFITLADTATTLKVDTSTFPTNGGAVFAWTLNPNGQVISVDSSSIDTSSWASVTLTTNAYNDLIFRKAPYATTFKVQGE